MTRRLLLFMIAAVALVATLGWLRDPAWLDGMETGFRAWTSDEHGVRGRWIGGHASFFVPADAGGLVVPLRTTFATPDEWPIAVTLTIDDRPVDRLTLTNDGWRESELRLPPPASRHLRRIDIRSDRVRDGNRSVMVGEIRLLPAPAAARPFGR